MASFGRSVNEWFYRDVDRRIQDVPPVTRRENEAYTHYFIDLVDGYNQALIPEGDGLLNDTFSGLSVKNCEEAVLGKSGVWSKALSLSSVHERIKGIRHSTEHGTLDGIYNYWQGRVDSQ
ncbi:MAG: hypothetical protein HC842_03285 [Cytophagales bacterium]|nr:hypothetical protein [Cytophagales bacterium]